MGTAEFVTITKDEFEGILPAGSKRASVPRSRELVYDIPTPKAGLVIRIYSSIHESTGVSRGLGEDAIRIVFWDAFNDRPLGKGKRINRVEGKTTIGERIKSRIDDFLTHHKDQKVVDFEYVKAILSSPVISRSNFALSLLEQVEKRGSLSENQLAYVLGDKSPKGYPTFESKVKIEDPGFLNKYLSTLQEVVDLGPSATPEHDGYKTPTEKAKIQPLTGAEVQLVPTTEYGAHKYPFEYFNPVQSLVYPARAEDHNMVIGANTSAGKTIAAELIMDTVLQDERVIYLSPLKSLTQEKYNDWQKRFPDQKITILTGDYTLSKEMMDRLAESQIIVMTSEMMDSRTRRMKKEKNFWLAQVGLVIVDESHILTTERGHAVETGIMRFSSLNPHARIVFLSATMPNVDELGEWLTSLNGKQTDVIYCNWRPVKLNINYVEYLPIIGGYGREDYHATQELKRQMAVDLVMDKPDEKFLVFVHDKGTGRMLVNMLKRKGEEAQFHNADLDREDRLGIEESFRQRKGGLRVMVSTSTTAWGVNLPARNVVIVGVHRGINEVDELDIIQMAGRAGRYGIDDAGFVYLIIPERSTKHWEKVFESPRPVKSVLNNHNTLAFHVLAEVESKVIHNERDMLKWFRRSLAFKQKMDFTLEDAKGLMDDLETMQMVKYKDEGRMFLQITGLGLVSAWLYYSPYDIHAWYKNFSAIFNGRKEKVYSPYEGEKWIQKDPIGLDDLTLAWALGDIPTNDWGYIPKNIQEECEDLQWRLEKRGIRCGTTAPFVLAIHRCLRGEETTQDLGIMVRAAKYDVSRASQALFLIDSMYAKWGRKDLWDVLPDRVIYSIPEELVQLVQVPGIGSKRAKMLWNAGIENLEDLADPDNRSKVRGLFSPKFADQIIDAAKRRIAANE